MEIVGWQAELPFPPSGGDLFCPPDRSAPAHSADAIASGVACATCSLFSMALWMWEALRCDRMCFGRTGTMVKDIIFNASEYGAWVVVLSCEEFVAGS